jgi:hypothetical protein
VRAPTLRSEFEPLRSLDVFPDNLPFQASSVIGRVDELANVIGAVLEARIVTLTGVGGVSKTALLH